MGVDYIHNVADFRSLLSSSGNKLVRCVGGLLSVVVGVWLLP